MSKEIKLKLKEESWEHFLNHADMDRDYMSDEDYELYGNLHEYLLQQYKMCTGQNVNDIDEIIDPAQIDLFNQ